MAKQRQTNVNINYAVNTVDVERGNGLLVRASKATDDLRKSTENYGKSAASSYKFASRSIEGMEIEVARLKQQIKLASVQNTADVSRLSAQYKSAKQQLDLYNKSLLQTQTAVKQNTVATQGLATQFGQVYSAIKLVIAAGLARELVDMSLSAATLTGNVEGVERAFYRAFPQGKILLHELREATHGAVSDFVLMQRTLQATNLGVGVDHLGTLFEFAAARAQQTGESVDYLVDSIVRGIGRKSVLVLDNLGLSTTRLKAQFDGAAIASKSVAEVTEGVAEIAKVELAKMGGYLETSKTQVDQLSVSWRGLREEAAKAITSEDGGGIIGYLKEYVQSFRVLIQSYNEGKTVSEVFAEKKREEIALISAGEFLTRRLGKDKKENIAIVQEEIQAITEELGAYTRFRDTMERVNEEKRDELKNTGFLKSLQSGEHETILETIALNERLLESKKNDALIDQEILKILQAKVTALKTVNKEEEKAGEVERKNPPKPMTQVVDLRYRDPDTGRISKERNNKILTDFIGKGINLIGAMPPAEVKITPIVLMTEWERALQDQMPDILDASSTIIQEQIDSLLMADVQAYDMRIQAARSFYDEQVLLAGDNERVKSELRIKEDREIRKLEQERADREKKAARGGIIVNTALGIMKAFATAATIYDGLIQAGIVAARGASQLIVADRAQYYAKGEIDIKGPGTKTSDSIPAFLSVGESIMTADETAQSKGIFKAVRARKLNDKILNEIVSGRSGGAMALGFDDSRLLKKLDEVKNSQPDILQRANLAYEIRRDGDSYKKIIRSKSLRS